MDARTQHAKLKAAYPDRIALVELGEQYMSYDDDAQIIHNVLGIEKYETVDDDFNPNGHNTFFSRARLDMFVEKLVAAGHKVAVCVIWGLEPHFYPEETEQEPTHYISGFIYNEQGICIKGMLTTYEVIVKRTVYVKVEVAQGLKAWVAGMHLQAKDSGFCYGIDEDSDYQYETSEKATLAAVYIALNWMRRAFSDKANSPETKNSINICIGKLCDFINGRPSPMTIDGKSIPQSSTKTTEPKQPVPAPIMPTQLQLL